MKTVLVTGGTGTLGRLVVPLLRDAGCEVRVLSRQGGAGHVRGDLATGAGTAAAVSGADVIVHCAGSGKGDGAKARNLVRAASEAGRAHLVYISVVGADRVPVVSRADRAAFGFYAEKHAAEQVVAGSGLPWTTLRATQFHELTLLVARQLCRLPVLPVPAGVRFQPVAAREVAARLAQLALGAPAGLVPDVAGPEVHAMTDLLRVYLRATGRRRPIVSLPMPGVAYRAIRDGANLAPLSATGTVTWTAFLAEAASQPAEGGEGQR